MKRIPLRLDEHGLESLLIRSQKWLSDYVPQKVWYPKELYGWQGTDVEAIDYFKKACYSGNNSFIDTDIHKSKNIYAIWTQKKYYPNIWNLKYIGQRHSSGIKDRLRNHLFGSPFGFGLKPNSKFKNISDALYNNEMIYLSYVQVSPESLRTFIEHSLICINTEKGALLWNSHGSKNAAKDIEELKVSGICTKKILET